MTAPEGSDGIVMAQGVERLRDLVRRALLARICLAAGEPPMWPLNAQDRDDSAVDVAMADDAERVRWRDSWRQALGPAGFAAQPRDLSVG